MDTINFDLDIDIFENKEFLKTCIDGKTFIIDFTFEDQGNLRNFFLTVSQSLNKQAF